MLSSAEEVKRLCDYASKGDVANIDHMLSLKQQHPSQVVLVNCKNTIGNTPLHYACTSGHVAVVDLLCGEKYHATVDCQNNMGNTPLHCACGGIGISGHGHIAVVDLLCGTYHATVDCKNYDGWTPLQWACCYGQVAIVELLCDKYHATVACKNNNGDTPLHSACEKGHVAVVELLCGKYHATVDCKDSNGKTPLDLAKTAEIKELLTKYALSLQQQQPPSTTTTTTTTTTITTSPTKTTTTTQVKDLSVAEIADILQQLGLSEHTKSFSDNEINGRALLELKEEDLRAELGMKLGPRKILLSFIESHRVAAEKSQPEVVKPQQETIPSERISAGVETKLSLRSYLQFPKTFAPKSCAEELHGKGDVLEIPQLETIISNCEEFVEDILSHPPGEIQTLNLAQDNLMAIALYTYDLGTLANSPKDNLYFKLNEDLRVRQAMKMDAWRGFLFHLLQALSKFPQVNAKVFRGVRADGKVLVQKEYAKGRKVRWTGFTSSTTIRNVASCNFAGKGGVLFEIRLCSGRDISSVSYITGEGEILISPNTTFVVASPLVENTHTGEAVVVLEEQTTADFIF